MINDKKAQIGHNMTGTRAPLESPAHASANRALGITLLEIDNLTHTYGTGAGAHEALGGSI